MTKLAMSHISAGITAVVVGYSSAVVLVIEAAKASGASDAIVESWLLAVGLGMGLTTLYFSWRNKIPLITAWSTPGAAFLIGNAQGYSLNEIIGACLAAGVLSLISARVRYLSAKIESIPASISSAMLAGILLPICLNVFNQATDFPLTFVTFISLYVVGFLLFPRFLMIAVLLLATGFSIFSGNPMNIDWQLTISSPVWIQPEFTLAAFVGIALPLFLITQLSQNIPGIAILKLHGHKPDHQKVLTGIAATQVITSPFGGFSFNYAAITAAICMGEDAGKDPKSRYLAAIVTGTGYVLLGLFSWLVVVVFSAMSQVIIALLAGLALLSTLQNALSSAFSKDAERMPALLVMLCTASGFTLFSLSSAVWGLLLGLVLLKANGMQSRLKARQEPK